MTQHLCESCGTPLVCPKCNPPKKRPLNAQAQAVKTCLDAYVAGRESIKQPYPGVPPVGCVVRWLGQQPVRDGAVKLFVDAVALAVNAHRLDQQFHAMPATIPKFVEAIPKLNQKWTDDARRNARQRAERGETQPERAAPVTPEQSVEFYAERQRLNKQTTCAAEVRLRQRTRESCGSLPECRGCPQEYVENPGAERSRSSVGRGPRQVGGFKSIAGLLPAAAGPLLARGEKEKP